MINARGNFSRLLLFFRCIPPIFDLATIQDPCYIFVAFPQGFPPTLILNLQLSQPLLLGFRLSLLLATSFCSNALCESIFLLMAPPLKHLLLPQLFLQYRLLFAVLGLHPFAGVDLVNCNPCAHSNRNGGSKNDRFLYNVCTRCASSHIHLICYSTVPVELLIYFNPSLPNLRSNISLSWAFSASMIFFSSSGDNCGCCCGSRPYDGLR